MFFFSSQSSSIVVGFYKLLGSKHRNGIDPHLCTVISSLFFVWSSNWGFVGWNSDRMKNSVITVYALIVLEELFTQKADSIYIQMLRIFNASLSDDSDHAHMQSSDTHLKHSVVHLSIWFTLHTSLVIESHILIVKSKQSSELDTLLVFIAPSDVVSIKILCRTFSLRCTTDVCMKYSNIWRRSIYQVRLNFVFESTNG